MAKAGTDNPHTRAIATFVSSLRYEDVPEDVRARIKLLMLDSFGCGLYGAKLAWSQILRATLAAVDVGDAAAVWGTRERLSSPHATLVNGTQIQGFELDDVHRQGVLHVGAVTLPGVVAIAEAHREMSGAEFLTATVAGYEVGPRVGMCMGQEHIGQGWHSGATVGVFAAAAGCARALKLDRAQTVHALGIGGTQAAGLMGAQFGAMVKRMHAGRSAQSGLYAALLAARGFTGMVDVFEAPYGGFCSTFSRVPDWVKMDELSAGLGSTFETMRISLKFYACVGSNHTTLDAIRDIRQRRPFEIDEIDEIEVRGSQVTVDHVGWEYRPEGLTSAQLNLAYCVATLLLEGDVNVDQFTEAALDDADRLRTLRLVRVLHDPEITALGARFRHKVKVAVRFKDGSAVHEEREAPRGSEASFASEADIVAKFRTLTADVLDLEAQGRLIDAVLDLDRLRSAREFTSLLALN